MDQIRMDDLGNIEWSEEWVSLSDFVKTYSLPQIVEVVDGYDGGTFENTIASEEVLKLHKRTTEKVLTCTNGERKVFKFPVRDQYVNIIPPNINMTFQCIEDLSRAIPLPDYVIVSNGYSMKGKHGNVYLKEGEILEIVCINNSGLFSKHFTMTLRKSNGALIKLPSECNGGFKPYIVHENRLLRDVLSSKVSLPFDFMFVQQNIAHYDTLRAVSIEESHLVMASCANSNGEIAFMLPEDLHVTLKVALGTIRHVPTYETLKTLFQNYESLENQLQKSEKYQQGAYVANDYQMYSVPLEKTSKCNAKESKLNATTAAPLPILPPKPLLPPRKSDSNRHTSVINNNTNDNQNKLIAPTLPAKPMSKPTDKSLKEEQNKETRLNSSYNHSIVNSQRDNDKGDEKNNSTNLNEINTPVKGTKHLDQVKSTVPLNKTPHVNANIYQPLQDFDKKSKIYESLHFDKPSTPDNPDQSGIRNQESLAEIKKMDTATFVEVLRILNLQHHVQKFVDNQVNGCLFCELDGEELGDLGLNKFEIKKLMKFKKGWRPT